MNENKQILDEFGELVVKNVFDTEYRFILNTVEDLAKTEGYKNLFKEMNSVQKKEIEYYTRELLKGTIFDFLKIFEENTQFKIVYDKNGSLIDLEEISEMLKAELIIENGWLARFSKEIDKDEIL